jgi:signal transduction histidine kinase
LQEAVAQFESTQTELSGLDFTEAQQATLVDLAEQAREQADRPPELDALARSDREYELETWMEERAMADVWDCAPTLVSLNYDPAGLATMAEHFASNQLTTVIRWLNGLFTVHNLLAEIGQGAGRISEIVKALKSYSYLDQAPVQVVDVHEGLDDTLLILRHKLKSGISVRREYAPELPQIQAYGSELNQVWTNILDNAADALNGQGQIIVRTHQDGDWVLVDIEDDGPGIPPAIQNKLFDPFFTTKPPGQGTGLGLDISYNIVVHKHRGDIKVFSQPGQTRFQVRLPVNFEEE